ncbi:hypothetical protein CRG98_021895 [Punica granatum]|uniref:Uncharacterized protein n=1 Tax=Punica granatum TaxID=22663 RepID=A0A2I0JN51_PUNGR|nr:hypothetical protein CRG98_021895 [Punica granatum]
MNKTRHRRDIKLRHRQFKEEINKLRQKWGATDTTPRRRQNITHSEVELFEPFALANSRDKRIEPARSKTPRGDLGKVTLGLRTLRELGIPKGNGQVIYSNTIPDQLSYRTQPSKADSSSSTAGDQARNPNSLKQPTPTEGRKRRGGTSHGKRELVYPFSLGQRAPQAFSFLLVIAQLQNGP